MQIFVHGEVEIRTIRMNVRVANIREVVRSLRRLAVAASTS